MTNFVTTKRALLTSVLSLVLCFAMLLGTTFAWFTDTVTSSGNVIQTGDLDVEMYYAKGTENPETATWNNADGKPIFSHNNWEPGYADAKHIKIENAGTLAFNWMLRITSSDVVGKLAEVIDVYYFEAATAHTSRTELANAELLGTLEEVMNTTKNISNKVQGTLLADEEVAFTLVLVMQESAGNEYQGLTISDLSIEVFATQVSHESDSFDEKYDSNLPSLELPAAYVREIGKDEVITLPDDDTVVIVGKDNKVSYTLGIGGAVEEGNLDRTFQFLPTETLEAAEASEYQIWHADFVVKMDGDVAANSIALAGYYDAWCQYNKNNWVAMVAGEDISAGTEIRLVELLGATVNYEELCRYGNDGLGFICGVADLDGSNAGKTLTVELRVYETLDNPHEAHTREDGTYCNGATANCETGYYITLGEFNHTFPAQAVADTTELEAAIENGVTSFSLGSGTYTMPAAAKGKNLTIIGNGDTVVSVVDSGASEGDIDYSLEGSNVTFENVTIKMQGSSYPGYARIASATYNNCTFEGANYCLYGDSVFNNCTFNLTNGYVWTWSAANVEFNNCTFESTDGSSKAILVHNTVETTVTVRACTFISTTASSTWDGIPVAAVSIDPENGSPDATVYFEGTNTYSSAFNGLYQVKYADEVDDVKVYVNGTEVTVPVGKP